MIGLFNCLQADVPVPLTESLIGYIIFLLYPYILRQPICFLPCFLHPNLTFQILLPTSNNKHIPYSQYPALKNPILV